MNKGNAYTTRSLQSLDGRWDFIKEQVTKFAGYHQQVMMDNRSEHSDADKVFMKTRYVFVYRHTSLLSCILLCYTYMELNMLCSEVARSGVA